MLWREWAAAHGNASARLLLRLRLLHQPSSARLSSCVVSSRSVFPPRLRQLLVDPDAEQSGHDREAELEVAAGGHHPAGLPLRAKQSSGGGGGAGAGERTVEKILARSAALAGRSANGEPCVGPCAPYAAPLEAEAGWLRASIAALSLLPPPPSRSARTQDGTVGGAAAPSLGFRGGHRGGGAALEVRMAQLDPSVVCGRDLGVGGTRGQAQRRVGAVVAMGVWRRHGRAAARYMRAAAVEVSAPCGTRLGWGETAPGRLRPPPHSTAGLM